MVRDSLFMSCDGFDFHFIQKEEVVTGSLGELKGRFVGSSEVLVRNVRKRDVDKVLKILDRICWMLSFAALSRVMCYGHEYPDGSDLGKRVSVLGEAVFFRPSLDIRVGKIVVEYINNCYEKYKILEVSRELNVVIDYLVQAERPAQPIELKIIIAFIVLENLKGTYARSVNIPYKNGFFRKSKKHKNGGDKYSFEELLQVMLAQVKMKKGLKRVKSLRNEIIHSGVTRKSHSWQWRRYEMLHDLLREYILRIMGYSGDYLSYSSAGREIKKL